MGRFGVAAILAALCSSLCLYGSSRSGGDFKYAARNKLDDTFSPRTMGSLLCSLLASKRTGNHRWGSTRGWQQWHSSSSSDSELGQCANYRVKYQHEYNNHGVKTLYSELCSSRAQACVSSHTRAPGVPLDQVHSWDVDPIPAKKSDLGS